MLGANNTWLLSFDNASEITPKLSDAFCRLATGDGYAKRQLYTDKDEIVIKAARPVLLNGISNVVGQSDLADRTLFISLPAISSGNRMQERELLARYEDARPRILGALYSAVASAMKKLPDASSNTSPGLIDMAHWCIAGEKALGLESGGFEKAFKINVLK